MKVQARELPASFYQRISLATALAAVLIGSLALIGWVLDASILKSMVPGMEPMRANAALAFILSGASLLLSRAGVSPARRGLARALAVMVGLIALVTLAEYALQVNAGIDEALFRDPSTSPVSPIPGRMAPNTALGLLMISAALLLMDVPGRRSQYSSQGFALATGTVALLAVVGYGYGVQAFTSPSPYIQMPANTAVVLLLLAVGVLHARPNQALMARISGEGVGGILLRRVLPAAVGVPLLLGLLVRIGGQLGLYASPSDLAVLAVLSSAVFFVLTWNTSSYLDRIDLARRLAEEESSRLANDLGLLLESTDEGLYGIDKKGLCTFINAAAARMLGYNQEEPIGKNMHDLIHHTCEGGRPYLKDECPIYEAFHEGKGVRVDDEIFWRRDGTCFPVEYSSYPIVENGEIRGAVVAFLDITSRRESEAAIKQLNESLSRRASDLAAANKELEAFSYSVSHDLRAPLRSIDGFSQALLEDYAEALDEAGRDYLSRVRTASQRMGELIDDMLALSRLTRSEMRSERVNLSELVSRIAGDLRATEPDRPVEFVIQPNVVVDGDARLLGIVVQNLVGNAWKFTSRKASGRIEFGAAEVDGRRGYYVRDNGAGFEMAYVGKLFGAFQRLHGMTEYPGNGIGLATVQRIIHRHGGRVWAEGEVDKGATFWFTL